MICRAKSLLTNEFVEGGFIQGKHAWIVQIKEDGTFSHILVDPDTAGRFTELTDKDGNRIFEGDLIRYGNRTGYVNYGTGCFCIHDTASKNNPAIDMIKPIYDVKIIGNIHDNPELLQEVLHGDK